MGRRWTFLLAVLFVALLGWILLTTEGIRRTLRDNSQTMTEIFSLVQRGINEKDPQVTEEILFQLQDPILATGVPFILSGVGDTVIAVENLPFDVDIRTPEGQRRVRAYMETLDATNPSVGSEFGSHLHFGDPPQTARLRWIPFLQAGGLLLTLLLGLTVVRQQRRAEAERAWTSMARELAHQLGTPLSSLQGWLELLRTPMAERPGGMEAGEIAVHLEGDLERLERVSRRFELIGRTTALEPLALPEVLEDLESYLQARLPRLGPGVHLEVTVPNDLPQVRGNRVLLVWALENIVKNALDALAGGGGSIRLRASTEGDKWVELRISDSGPGVPIEVRERLFEPGVTTKSSGWGVGLALSRRIVEGVHGGRITLLDTAERGATFAVKLPRAPG